MTSAKILWESLEKKYKTEDAGQKKFIVGRFLDYKMVDSRTTMSHLGELLLIIHAIVDESMKICEMFQVATIIEKLPPFGKDFRSYLKHKKNICRNNKSHDKGKKKKMRLMSLRMSE